jgi:hypothetical protein
MAGAEFFGPGWAEAREAREAEQWATPDEAEQIIRDHLKRAGVSALGIEAYVDGFLGAAPGSPIMRDRLAEGLGLRFPIEGKEYGKNPAELVTFSNPGKLLGYAHELRYRHVTEGHRVHEFDGTERIELLDDGSFRVYHPRGKRLWEEWE